MNVKTLFLTCAAALSLLLFSCDNQIGKKPAPKPASQTKTNTVKKPAAQPQAAKPAQPQPPKPAQQQVQKPAQKPSMMDDVNSVINYGTGATAIQAKKRMTDKLNKAQGQHNKQLDDALK
ncbi:MAG: hypothetical protein IKR81_16010 [Victivallales bacterium]|nr:hypothetical protein [Victivallales bacterium]